MRERRESRSDDAAPAGPSIQGHGETVLVVEDNAAVSLMVAEVLEDMGYRHIEAPDAESAIPHLQSDRAIDLMIADIGLPHMNGRQLAEIARQHRPGLKVLFITGHAETAALPPGMQTMTKPFALDALGAKIQELLGR